MAKIITAYVSELLQQHLQGVISFSRMVELLNEKANEPESLPLEVPSRVETLLKSSDNEVYVNDQQRIGFQKGAAWAIDEIIKRNK